MISGCDSSEAVRKPNNGYTLTNIGFEVQLEQQQFNSLAHFIHLMSTCRITCSILHLVSIVSPRCNESGWLSSSAAVSWGIFIRPYHLCNFHEAPQQDSVVADPSLIHGIWVNLVDSFRNVLHNGRTISIPFHQVRDISLPFTRSHDNVHISLVGLDIFLFTYAATELFQRLWEFLWYLAIIKASSKLFHFLQGFSGPLLWEQDLASIHVKAISFST